MFIAIVVIFLVGLTLIMVAPKEEKTRTQEVIKYRTLQKTSVLEAIADATVSPSKGSKETELEVGRLYGIAWISYVRFNLSDIPANATIESIELKLKSKTFIPQGNRWIRVANSSIEWTENEITWDNKPERDRWLDTKWIELMEEWYSWDCTDAAINKENLSLALELLEGMDGLVVFYSRESEYKPRLEVKYTIEEPYTVTLTQTYTESHPIAGVGALLFLLAIILFLVWVIMRWMHRKSLMKPTQSGD